MYRKVEQRVDTFPKKAVAMPANKPKEKQLLTLRCKRSMETMEATHHDVNVPWNPWKPHITM